MANKRIYEIAFVGLTTGVHEFNYDVDDKFFVEKGVTDFANCKAHVKLLLDKKVGFMMLKFEIGGTADVLCDRCGNTLTTDIWDEFNMVVKMVENPTEMNDSEEDPDVFYISRTESHIDVETWIYEFILLSFPLQNVCGTDADGESKCNKDVLEKLEEMRLQAAPSNELWKGLNKFKSDEN